MREPVSTGPAGAAPSAVVFDLDGTLVDTAPGIGEALNARLRADGRRALAAAEVRRFIGDGIVTLAARAFAATGEPLTPDAAEAVGRELSARLAAAPPGPSDLYPGCVTALAALSAAGRRLGVCTNKPHGAARTALASTGLAPRVGALVGGGSLPARKPDPAPLLETLTRLGVAPSRAVYVGDSEVDAETAAAAGLPFVLVGWGYRRGPLEALVRAADIDRFEALAGEVDRLLGAAGAADRPARAP
jgi:phosphoglycolate phosphatase